MTRKVKTGKVSGGADYAYVADRLKQFREDCPNGLIETTPTLTDNNQIIFSARVLKDKNKPESGEATGHAFNKMGDPKVFEKTETQALGRALALLGYLASGEIASAEEMEDFFAYQQLKIDEAVTSLNDSGTLEELKTTFMSLGSLMAESAVIEAKDKRKAELTK